MNFCWSSSLIVQSIYNRVQKVGTRTPAAAGVTLPRERWLRPGSRGEPCAPRQQSGERETSAKPKELSGSSCAALSCQPLLPLTQLLRGSHHSGCIQRTIRDKENKLVSFSARKRARFCFSRHLFSSTSYLTGRKLFLFLPQNIKRGFITKRRVGQKVG